MDIEADAEPDQFRAEVAELLDGAQTPEKRSVRRPDANNGREIKIRIRPMVALASTAALLAAVSLPGPASAASEPTPTVPAGELAAALTCKGNLAKKSGPAPVLLVPGSSQTSQSQFSWNFMPALTKAEVAWCAVSPPVNQMGDIQIAAEYVAYAIKTLYKAAGRKINVVGHSQGGMQPRWVLKYWPGTRTMVEDLIGIAPPPFGSTSAGRSS